MPTDPVCGMFVEDTGDALRLVRENRSYYFCSTSCLATFAEPERERRRLGRRLLIAWPVSVVVLVLTYGTSAAVLAYVSAALAAVVQVYAGAPFYRGAYDAVRHRVGNMDLLIAVATTSAFVYSVAALAQLPGLPRATYFDASSLIITLILTGNYLEQQTRSRAGSAVRRLEELLPRTASRVDQGKETEVPVGELRSGDLVRVRPGARFPVDGTVSSGTTSAEEALLTGEPGPVPKAPGSAVLAGSMNLEGMVEVATAQVGADTFVAEVGRLLTAAELSRVPLQRTADRIAAAFVPFVLSLALIAGIAWYWLGGADFTVAVLIFVTVAITACPCAFGIATPAAILVGTGRAAEEGVLFRGEDAIERAARVDLVLTDKTGTLTSGTVDLASVDPIAPAARQDVLALVAGLESASDHVLARAVRRAAAREGLTAAEIQEVRIEPGEGVRGTKGGQAVGVLRGTAARAQGVDLSEAKSSIDVAEAAGESWSVVLSEGEVRGVLRFRTRTLPGTVEAVQRLRGDGIDVVMVTGDSAAAAKESARELGITRVHSEVRPAEKVAIVRQYRSLGHRVAFVGDGVNDAAALAEADVGIAIGTGAEVAREAGQVLLVRPDFSGVPEALEIARRTVAKVRGNLTWAIGYNLVLLPVAAGALVPWFGLTIYTVLPVFGALAMGISSTTVVLNSLSLRRAVRTPVLGFRSDGGMGSEARAAV
jgi:P-type Cu+ transporter